MRKIRNGKALTRVPKRKRTRIDVESWIDGRAGTGRDTAEGATASEGQETQKKVSMKAE